MKYKSFVLLPSFETNTYLVWEEMTGEAMLIDPSAAGQVVAEMISEKQLKLKYIVNTHGHGDHIGGNHFFKNRYPAAKLCIHPNDAEMLVKSNLNLSLYYEQETISPQADIFLEDEMVLELGGKEVKVMHTPGHTQGGVSLYCEGLLFSGDTLFSEDVGRTDLPGGNYTQLIASIKQKLYKLPDSTVVLPGHCDKTTIGTEKKSNIYAAEE